MYYRNRHYENKKPVKDYCLLSQVNTLNRCRQATWHPPPQGQALRFPHGWLKISGSPKHPPYNWVDHRVGCTRNQVLGRSQSLEHIHFTVKINICIYPELWITNKSSQKTEDWLNLLPYSKPLCTKPLTSYQVQIIQLANVQMRQCTLRKEAYYIIWESELAATLQDA